MAQGVVDRLIALVHVCGQVKEIDAHRPLAFQELTGSRHAQKQELDHVFIGEIAAHAFKTKNANLIRRQVPKNELPRFLGKEIDAVVNAQGFEELFFEGGVTHPHKLSFPVNVSERDLDHHICQVSEFGMPDSPQPENPLKGVDRFARRNILLRLILMKRKGLEVR